MWRCAGCGMAAAAYWKAALHMPCLNAAAILWLIATSTACCVSAAICARKNRYLRPAASQAKLQLSCWQDVLGKMRGRGYVVRQSALACQQECTQRCRVIRTGSALDRGPCGQRRTPGANSGRASEEPKVLKLLEHVEIAEYRPEYRIHHREALSGKVRPSAQLDLDLLELGPDIRGLGRERFLVRRVVKPTDGIQHC